ncbi:kelch-like protein 5 [Oculina patagonica]
MYQDGRYSDVSLKIGHERTLRAHRVVLASFTPYFEALLGHNWEEGRKYELEIQGLDEEAVSKLIKFAYSGSIDINKDNVQALLEASNYLGAEFVKNVCADFLKDVVDDKTCLAIWQLADLFSLQELSNVAKQHALLHFSDVSKDEVFLLLPYNLLVHLLADKGLCVVVEDLIPCEEKREEFVLQAVFQYVEHDLENRRELLPELLSLVRLPTLSEAYLKDVTTHRLVTDSCTCKEVLEKAKKLKMEFEILKERAILEDQQIDPPEEWAVPRDFAQYVVTWGHSFANSGHIPETLHYTDVDTFEDLENNCYVNGMELWFRQWDGKLVLGGLKMFYSEGGPMTFGCTGDPAQEHHKFHLKENEKITKVEVSSNWMIHQLTFYTNKKDDSKPKHYGPFGGDGGLLHSETPAGCFGFLAGVAGAVVTHQGGKPGIITRLQFAWRSYAFPGDPVPEKYSCRVGEDVREDDYNDDDDDDDDVESDDDDDDESDSYDNYSDFEDFLYSDQQPTMFDPLA